MGADATARAIEAEAAKRGREVRIVRNGSRGLYWLEPLVEVVTAAGRVAYGPVSAAEVPKLLDAGMLEGAPHALRLGDIGTHPYLASQQRLTGARLGIVDPSSLVDYVAHDGYVGLRNALAMQPLDIVRAITDSGLRGRGGAAFPTGIKWQTVHDQKVEQKYIACNADEGDSGTFSDRMLMEGDPFSLIEGMTIAGLAVGATQGYIYLRVEYPHAARSLAKALQVARAVGYLGQDILGSGKRFDIAVRLGAGAYICGEETSMLESLEGRRGEVRVRPPLPAIKGLFGQPTVVNNVVTLAVGAHRAGARRAVLPGFRHRQVARHHPAAARRQRETRWPGGARLRAHGESNSSTTTAAARRAAARCAPCRSADRWAPIYRHRSSTRRWSTKRWPRRQALLGHGGVVVFDDRVDMARMARYALEFCAVESCGKCTPCRIGSTRGVELVDRILADRAGSHALNGAHDANLALLDELCDTCSMARCADSAA